MAGNYTKDMTSGNPTKLLLMFTIPMLFGNLFQQIYNMADTIIVGQFVGDDALGAVGTTGSISFLLFSLTFGMASGIGIIVSQLFGAGDIKRVKKAIATSIYIMIASAILMGVIGIFSAEFIMVNLLETPLQMQADAIIYLQVTCGGLIAVALYNGVASILRALGDAKTPLIFLAVACIINVLLDLLFVVVFGMGVLGVAIATVIAQAVAGFGCIIYAWFKVPIFRVPKEQWNIDWRIFKQCIFIGLPVAIQNAVIAVSCIVLQKVVNGFGPTTISAFTAVARFEQLVHQPFTSLGVAVATFTGQNMGAGNIARVKKGFWSATIISTAFSLAMIPVAWLGGEAIMSIFTDTPAVIAEGARGIRITSLFYTSLGMIYVTRNVLNGAGDVNFALLSGFVEVAGRVGLAKPLTHIPAIGVLSIWYTSGITWFLTAAISCIRYAQGKWCHKAIVNNDKTNDEPDYETDGQVNEATNDQEIIEELATNI